MAAPGVLENDRLVARFDDHGLVALHDKALNQTLDFGADHWAFSIENSYVSSDLLKPNRSSQEGTTRRYFFSAEHFVIEVIYELKPGWRFLTKQLQITSRREKAYTVKHVDVCWGRLKTVPREIYVANMGEQYSRARSLGDYAAFLRMDDRWGGMFLMQNPYMKWRFDDGQFSMDHRLDLDWSAQWGPFTSDRACIGFCELTGTRLPAEVTQHDKWLMEPAWRESELQVDLGEVDAFVECVRAFLLFRPTRGEIIHVPWCENDYQIDVATDYGMKQFQRIVDSAAALGVRHMLYTVRNSKVADIADAADDWRWEHLLWLGQGIQIRKNQWDPKTDELPARTREMQAYADSKGIKLMAYVYPSLPFTQNPEWLTKKFKFRHDLTANFGYRSFQDWLIENLTVFKDRTGISGYAFDYWFLNAIGRSPYSQWYGTRRVLEELRKRSPDIVIDGRQSYHGWGPWTWLAGNYPHPTGGDEQPESFEAFPDLHFDRCSADQQRKTTYWYRQRQFCPTELMPGFITHQTPRNDAQGYGERLKETILRDWDRLGWEYSLISSIATAPFAHAFSMIPARDKAEFDLFMKDAESHAFAKRWFTWTDENIEILRHMRCIMGPPGIGKTDGTAAVEGDHGFIFLFNPNHRKLHARFSLDRSIGLAQGDSFVLEQLYPEKSKLLGRVYRYGDECSFLMDGTTAWVLELRPAPKRPDQPLLFNVRGEASLKRGRLELTQVEGEAGTQVPIRVLLPDDAPIRSLNVNGRKIDFEQARRVVTATVRFAGEPFAHNQAVTEYDPAFTGTRVEGEFTIPKRIFDQLAERRKSWPIEWTEEDLECTWLAPERLLLYIQLAEPNWKMDVGLKLNGKPVPVRKAYSSRTPGMLSQGKGNNTFVGFYADVSALKPGKHYKLEVSLPEGLKPGQFQGIFFENVETEFTDRVERK